MVKRRSPKPLFQVQVLVDPLDMKMIIVISGPTAVGKTSLSLHLASYFAGEIISVDSRQVYRKLDFGTGKVSIEEQSIVPHHMIDILSPGSPYSAHNFVKDASKCIENIDVPFLTGGSFFWLRALLYKNTLSSVPQNKIVRDLWENRSIEDIVKHLERFGVVDITELNKRRLIRYIEILESGGILQRNTLKPRYNVLHLSIHLPQETLEMKIKTRLEDRFDKIVEEINGLLVSEVSITWLQSLGLEYKFITSYVLGHTSKGDAFDKTLTAIRQFSKKQRTWLKSEKNIIYLNPNDKEKAIYLIQEFLTSKC